ncbi:MAG: FAD/NAD(P)-binding oxidoreductase [Acidimicrobiia bacterium]
MSGKGTVVVLGGGVGGLVAARALRRKLPGSHRVIVVDREDNHVFAPSLLWLMTGDRTAASISRPLARLRRRGIDFVRGEIRSIRSEHHSVEVDEEVIEGDHIVVSLGADLAPENIPGLAEAGFNLFTLAGAEALRDEFSRIEGGRVVVLTAAPAYKCPAAPYEAAMLLADLLRKRSVRDLVQIDIYAAEPGPLGVAGPEVSAGVRQMVESKGIGYHPEHRVVEVDPGQRQITFSNGARASFDVLAFVPPHRAPRVVLDSGLVDETGWVPVDRHTLETRHPGVYAIGDVTTIPLAVGKPLPMAGVFAHGQAEVVASNIARSVTGKGQPARFDGHGGCFIETGAGKAGFGRGDFYAEPTPQVKLYNVGRRWHLGKVVFEQRWLRRRI